jgi:hypothetical protein
MKGGLIIRDFDKVMPWLEKQFNIAKWYGGEDNRLVPGLLENIKFAYKTAVLKHERERFIGLLEKTRTLSPNNINLEIMLASAYQFMNKDKALLHLKNAKKIIPSDQRIYRLANIILRNPSDSLERDNWINSYKHEQFGDYEDYKSTSLLGVGYRRIALEFLDNDERKLILNEGVQIGKKVSYEFTFEKSQLLAFPSVRLSTGGGISVKFHEIRLFLKGSLSKVFTPDEIELYPETGYVFSKGVVSINHLGENIFIVLNKGAVEHMTDRVVIELSIDKLPLSNSLGKTF